MKHKHEDVKEHTRNNCKYSLTLDLFEENQIIIEVDKRVKDFLFLLTEIKKKENVIEQFENKVIRKREGISKVKFEVEKNEQIYLEQYQVI